MLAVLVASAIVDPIVLLGLLHLIAHAQVETKYSSLFWVNLVLGVVALVFCLFSLPLDLEENPLPTAMQIGTAVLAIMTVAAVTSVCKLSLARSVVVTILFWGYKAAMAYSLLRFLLVFGLEVDFQGMELDDLNASSAPEIFGWLLEHGLWFKTETP